MCNNKIAFNMYYKWNKLLLQCYNECEVNSLSELRLKEYRVLCSVAVCTYMAFLIYFWKQPVVKCLYMVLNLSTGNSGLVELPNCHILIPVVLVPVVSSNLNCGKLLIITINCALYYFYISLNFYFHWSQLIWFVACLCAFSSNQNPLQCLLSMFSPSVSLHVWRTREMLDFTENYRAISIVI
jgi:hypothetical protein